MEDKRVEVNLSLLLNMRSMFQVISQRGAFKPEEFKIVGSVYDTLTAAIQPYIPKDQPLDDDTETVMAASENPEPISQNGTTETIMTPTELAKPKSKPKPKTPRSKKVQEPKEPKEV